MNILSLLRKSNPQDLDSVLVFSSITDSQTYGVKWDDMVAAISASISGIGAAGDTWEVQYNDNGAFAANPNFAWNIGTNTLQINGSIAVQLGNITSPAFNGVALTNLGAATSFLNASGNYSVPLANPAGNDEEIQFNSGGSLSASTNLKWNGTSLVITGAGGVSAPSFNGVALTNAGVATNYLDATGNYSAPGAAGNDEEIQFNSSGAFAGSSSLTWDGTTLNATQFNGVALTTGGAATSFLDATGSYTSIVLSNYLDKTAYDPTNVGADVYDKANQIGSEQITGTIITEDILANQDNWNPTDFENANMIRILANSANRDITGMQAPPSGVNRIISISNVGLAAPYLNNIRFINNSASSLPENRFALQSGSISIVNGNFMSFWYDHVDQRWRSVEAV